MIEVTFNRVKLTIPEEYKKRPIIKLTEWLAALRDPASRQGRGCLAWVNPEGVIRGECCLGVYCRVRGVLFEDPVEPSDKLGPPVSHERLFGKEQSSNYLPEEVWIGGSPDLTITSHQVPHYPTVSIAQEGDPRDDEYPNPTSDLGLPVSLLNDQQRLTFAEIAFVLEHLFEDQLIKEDGQDPGVRESQVDNPG